jgi:hypothetical protein
MHIAGSDRLTGLDSLPGWDMASATCWQQLQPEGTCCCRRLGYGSTELA